MKQISHRLLLEYKEIKNKKEIEDVEPSVNGEKEILPFNLFWGAIFASNRNLCGKYYTLDFLEENKITIDDKNAPKITFLQYNFSNSLIFIQEDVKAIFPDFQVDDEQELYKLRKAFENRKITSFSTEIKSNVEADFGDVYEINFGKTILNYTEIEAIPIEYVQGIKKEQKKEQTPQGKEIEKKIEEIYLNTFEEALQYFYFSLKNTGRANLSMFKKFELYEVHAGAELVVNCDNNFVLSEVINKEKLLNREYRKNLKNL